MDKNKTEPSTTGEPEGEGHMLLNIGKIVFLVVVLAAFWYLFDKWLKGK